ncbi:MAG TPA: MFS transporter [Stellaceae bacterium]|nr:MFS transporter [Stellaceae bacterium]
MASLSKTSIAFIADAALNLVGSAKARIVALFGGPARLQVILVLAAVLAIDGVDKGTLSAVSDQLKHAFHIGNTEIGLLFSAVSFIGAAATLPMGILADRLPRRIVLMVAIALWVAAMAISGTATSYIYLLVTRLFLGATTAAAWPCVASLTGDFFPARERAGIYGWILAGELIGSGIGFFIAGEVESFSTWRWSFYVMAALTLIPIWAIWRYLPEPERSSQSWLRPGERDPEAAARPQPDRPQDGDAAGMSKLQKTMRAADIKPRTALILNQDPTRRHIGWVMRYLLKFPTYVLVIAASALAYYFFAGVRAFAMIYITEHFGLKSSSASAFVLVAGIGGLIGTVAGGRVAERLLKRGVLSARIVVPAAALCLSVPFLGAGIWVTNIGAGIILLTVGAFFMAAAVAPIDAARLDIILPQLWGRGESGRMALRSAFEGGAPLLFGAVSGWLGGGQKGLMWTFLLMLIPMLMASALVFPARKTYPRDVATAAASVEAIGKRKLPT